MATRYSEKFGIGKSELIKTIICHKRWNSLQILNTEFKKKINTNCASNHQNAEFQEVTLYGGYGQT